MTNPNKGGRPKKYGATIGADQQELIDAILNDPDAKKQKIDKDAIIDLSKLDEVVLTEEMILNGLKQMAVRGNVKAWELLGDKLGLFDTKEKESLLDVFAAEGTLEENIENMLEVLEDKYPDITSTSLLKLDDLPSMGNGATVTPKSTDNKSNNDEGAPSGPDTTVRFSESLNKDTYFPVGLLSDDKPVDPFVGAKLGTFHPVEVDPLDKALEKATKGRKTT